MGLKSSSAAGKILHNSFWYGLETLMETFVFLGTSIAVARYLGPEKLGYFSYINFFVTVVTRTSGIGLASATRKYMSEFLALDRPGTARAVYYLAYRYQLLGAIAITILGLAGVFFFGEPAYKLMSAILISSIIPGVMSWVPAQANSAFEDVSKNTLSAFGYILTYLTVILLTLHFHWDLVGVASALLVGRTVEVFLRTAPLHARLRTLPLDALDDNTIDRIRRFCFQSIGLQLLTSVVWDRSEMVFLRAFSSLEQVAFYSVSFGLANNLLLVPRTFGGATGITLMVESGRDPSRVDNIVRNASRFLLLVVFPVHLGAAAITSQIIRVTYGAKYIGAIPVLIIASILAIPRAFQEIPETLLRAADQQKRLLFCYIAIGILNLTLDALFIPRYGAVGAAWGNGLSQSIGIVVIWQAAKRFYRFGLPIGTALRLFLSGACMSVIAWFIARSLPGIPGLVLAIAIAAVSYVFLVKLFHGLQPSDRIRLLPIGQRLPGPARGLFATALNFLIPAPAEEVAPS